MRRKTRINGKYIAIREAERLLGVPYHRLYHWAKAGKLPVLSSDLAGRAIYIERAALDRFLADNTSEARS
jgi:excisionase family DNA binding protein